MEEEAKSLKVDTGKDLINVSDAFNEFGHIQLIFNSGTIEALIVKEKLNREKAGEKIAILRTDIPEKSLLIRIDGRRTGHQKADSENGNGNFKG